MAQLLSLNTAHGIGIRTNTALVGLIGGPDGRVLGARVNTTEGVKSIGASQGVLLAAGGFAHNGQMREKSMPAPESTEWTNTPVGDTRDAITAGMEVGAATALMDDAWWGSTIFDPVTGAPFFTLIERARPYCIIVDSSRSRFMNEAESYVDACHQLYKRNQTIQAIPAWLIMDSNHRSRYMIGTQLFAGLEPTQPVAESRMFKSSTIKVLACLPTV